MNDSPTSGNRWEPDPAAAPEPAPESDAYDDTLADGPAEGGSTPAELARRGRVRMPRGRTVLAGSAAALFLLAGGGGYAIGALSAGGGHDALLGQDVRGHFPPGLPQGTAPGRHVPPPGIGGDGGFDQDGPGHDRGEHSGADS